MKNSVRMVSALVLVAGLASSAMAADAAPNCTRQNWMPNWHYSNKLENGSCTVTAHCGQFQVKKTFSPKGSLCVVPSTLKISSNGVVCATVKITNQADYAIVNSLASAVKNSSCITQY